MNNIKMEKNIVQSVHNSIEDIFLRRNPGCKRQDLFWRLDGRLEWKCEHGTGHTIFSMNDHWTHGCDGCCKDLTRFSIKFYNVEQEKIE